MVPASIIPTFGSPRASNTISELPELINYSQLSTFFHPYDSLQIHVHPVLKRIHASILEKEALLLQLQQTARELHGVP